MTTYKLNGRVVHHPLAKLLVILVVLISIPIWAAMLIASIPVHFLLLLFGRRGFLVRTPGLRGDSYSYRVDLNGFREAR